MDKNTKLILDIIFLVVVGIITLIIFLIPTGFEAEKNPDAMQVKALVLETDNSSIEQYSIIKAGTQFLEIKILTGKFKGRVVRASNVLIGKLELDKFFKKGDKAYVVLDIDGDKILFANVLDHYRINIEFFLLIFFVLLLLGFARFTGAKAIGSFIFTVAVIWKILLPLFLKEKLVIMIFKFITINIFINYNYSHSKFIEFIPNLTFNIFTNPIFISIIITTFITFIIIFLVAGVNRKGIVAFLGAASGILLTCFLSIIFGWLFRIHGAVKPFSETLLYSGYAHINLSDIFLSGIFISSSGAVMDISMDIAASMREVCDKHPEITVNEAIKSGFTVGKAVVGTMTTTLLLAYTGGFTTMLMVFIAQRTPTLNILNLNYVSAEILHTLVGSFGLVCVAPITAIIGGILYVKWKPFKTSDK